MGHVAEILSDNAELIILWVGAICTFGIYSILYKENPYYRLAEHIFIGLAMGLGIFLTWDTVLKPKWWDLMVGKGQWWWALILPVGAMFYFIYSKRHAWISRLIMGAMMGMGAGVAFQAFANVYFPMVRGSFKPIIPTTWEVAAPKPGVGYDLALNNLIFIVVLITVMAYFFFSVDYKSKGMRHSAGLGRWFLMFAFGAMFGATVMARMALFIGRLDFLTTEWGPKVPIWFWITSGVIAVAIAAYFLLKSRRSQTVS